jgi:hypothetical protein
MSDIGEIILAEPVCRRMAWIWETGRLEGLRIRAGTSRQPIRVDAFEAGSAPRVAVRQLLADRGSAVTA